MILRGVLHKQTVRHGISSKNKADGPIDRMVSSNNSVKSNVDLFGICKKGPKLSSYERPVTFAPRGAKFATISMVSKTKQAHKVEFTIL